MLTKPEANIVTGVADHSAEQVYAALVFEVRIVVPRARARC